MAQGNHELTRMNSVCGNPKQQLLDWVKKNQIEDIRNLLAKANIDILTEKYDYPYCKPILYIACEDFANFVLPSTVETLINLGADVHYIDEETAYKEAIHFAVGGMNPDILEVVIRKMTKTNGINATSSGSTALHMLINNGNVDTKNFNKCLDLLLKSGIDVNKSNKKNVTAILWAAYRGYKDVVAAILNCGRYVDIDHHKFLKKSARQYIEEKQLYDGPLPSSTCDTNENKIELPIRYIKERREKDFLQLEDIDVNYETEEGTLLQQACDRNLILVVEYLLNNNADVYKTVPKNTKLPLEIIAYRGYHDIFKLLLDKYKPVPASILILLFSNMSQSPDKNVNYEECVWHLFEKKKQGLPVNDYSETGNTPLHYASGLSDTSLTLELLERGASLANGNKFNCLPVEDINPQTLEEHFNKCVTIKDQCRNDKQSIIVAFDYTSLIPTPTLIDANEIEEGKEKDIEYQNIMNQNDQKRYQYPVSETGVIKVMSKIPEMRRLLVHPLISSFIFIKWHRMRWFFWINLVLFASFCASLITLVFLPEDDEAPQNFTIAVQSFLLLTYVLLILRELFQMILSIRTYFCSLSNILEVIMLCICFYVIFYKSTDILYKQLSSIAMIFLALELMILLGQHPALSTNIVMLRTVTKNFFFFLLWYAVLILAFVLCFYNLFNNNGEDHDNATKSNSTDGNDEEEEQDFFREPGLTFIKTIVMLTGEFDASSLNLDGFLNKLIFLLFVFMVSIILFNLLNGLAVSDTQTIQNEAEIMGYIERINYIVYFENVILGNALPRNVNCIFQKYLGCCPMPKINIIPKFLVKQVSLIPDYLKNFQMHVLLYRKGRIIEGKDRDSHHCIRVCTDTCIDRKTIQRVKDLLHDKQNKYKEMQQIKDLQEIIKCQREIIKQLQSKNSS